MVTDYSTAGIVFFIISYVLPLLVGLVTTKVTANAVKAELLLALSVLASVLQSLYQALNNHVHWDWKTVVINAILAFVVGTAAHYGFWKPVGVAEAAANNGIKAPVIDVAPVKVEDKPIDTLEDVMPTQSFPVVSPFKTEPEKPKETAYFPPALPAPVSTGPSKIEAEAQAAAVKQTAAKKAPAKKAVAKKAPAKKTAPVKKATPAKKTPAKKVTSA